MDRLTAVRNHPHITRIYAVQSPVASHLGLILRIRTGPPSPTTLAENACILSIRLACQRRAETNVTSDASTERTHPIARQRVLMKLQDRASSLAHLLVYVPPNSLPMEEHPPAQPATFFVLRDHDVRLTSSRDDLQCSAL